MVGRLLHPPPQPREQTPGVSGVRAFVFLSGMRWMRERGYLEAFRRGVPERVFALTERTAPLEWVGLDESMTIYRALDALTLPLHEQEELGRFVSDANNGVIVSTMARLAGKLGVSPLRVVNRINSLWLRNNRGGAVAVYELGETALRLEFWAVPFAVVPFFRASMCGAIAVGLEPFGKELRVTEVPEHLETDGFSLRVSWNG